MKTIGRIFIVLLLLFFLFTPVNAQSGCCSWHGGVCGCAGISKLCCDGSLSPSCTCGYIYRPPPAPAFPQIQATWTYLPQIDKTFTLSVVLNDPNPSQYSATISKCRGCDPGPLVDFSEPNFYYSPLTTGRWYLNVKKEINGYWSTPVYWTIDIPKWIQPTPTPSPTPIPPPIISTENDSNLPVLFFLIVIGLFGLICLFIFLYGLATITKKIFNRPNQNGKQI